MARETTRSRGDKGEEIAVRFLSSKGYEIVERNWRSSTLEVDIICQKDEILVFVEVKFRKDNRFGDPSEFITEQKMENLSIIAGDYMEKADYKGIIRFDVIGIRADHQSVYKIRHLKDVHFSGWNP